MVDNSALSESPTQSDHRCCALCTTPARYKCPRCATPTCSLPCSRMHKQDTGCTGERDKVHYVPMNAYGWGTMMRDYCYLEDVGRKVSECGNDIVRGGYMGNTGASKAASMQKFSRGRKSTTGRSKRDALRNYLETLRIDVELLPAGMERRNVNQSTFDQKSKCPLLTIELVFYPPTTLASISSSAPPSYKILSHRNSLSSSLLAMLQRQVSSTLSKSQKQKENIPDWLPSTVIPHPEATECFVPPHCYIRANTEFPQAPNAAYYHKLESTLDLGELFQGTSFVEFPTIHVFDPEASSFSGIVIDKTGSIVHILEDDHVNAARAAKRRKLNKTMGLKAVSSLIGGYGSEGSFPSEEEETEDRYLRGLATLEAYSGSEDEVTPKNIEVEETQSLNSDDDDAVPAEGNQLDLDPARLLEFVKQARSAADEDILDWGDEWDTESEEQKQLM
ncbi:hypothetical protein L210DRAFT_3609054 [Boletus edulis BED1]|uniref:HIT-type domain-containing protein n=1 Tax=Boletus edulis BED1 TaxID=1328754 RepID=A0AAD4GLB3_BOLED|nr:hypothetical protein L210DRAFT_3609054 [Boletus edulis BED1]